MIERDRIRQLLESDRPIAPAHLYAISLDALDHALFEEIVSRVEAVPPNARDHRLWQIMGLARRAMLDAGEAHAAFARAAALAPRDGLIAHSVARTAAESGLPAIRAYANALALCPSDAGVMLGLASARLAEGDSVAALAGLAGNLAANPGWYEGHSAYARIASVAGKNRYDSGALIVTVEQALRLFPRDAKLWRTLIRILLDAHDYPGTLQAISTARSRLGDALEWTRIEAICLSEGGEPMRAQAIFDVLGRPARAAEAVHPVRNLIRIGRLEEAASIAEQCFGQEEDHALWPYRALLWRVLGDDRWQWLEGDPRLIGIHDLASELGDLDELAAALRSLHARSGTMLDQSVRGGTQTDGNLFARSEPSLRRLRTVIHAAVSEHVAQWPAALAGHPTFIARRAPLRFAGAWSVRLVGSGRHVDHVHPQGWLSSAFYVTLPTRSGDADGLNAGWLALGEARDLLPDFDGFRIIQPAIGRLILFPSSMWHGTRPFREGERMTVAFDIARP